MEKPTKKKLLVTEVHMEGAFSVKKVCRLDDLSQGSVFGTVPSADIFMLISDPQGDQKLNNFYNTVVISAKDTPRGQSRIQLNTTSVVPLHCNLRYWTKESDS